jgi:hypothetical protein
MRFGNFGGGMIEKVQAEIEHRGSLPDFALVVVLSRSRKQRAIAHRR